MDTQKTNQSPKKKLITSIVIYLDAAAWIVYGITAGLGLIPGLPAGELRWEMAGLIIATGAIIFILYAISSKHVWAFYLLLGLLALISLLSLTDQVGLLDWIAYAINLAALVLLVLEHRRQG
jgi:hypothetical protein